jgi:hypothetical protein
MGDFVAPRLERSRVVRRRSAIDRARASTSSLQYHDAAILANFRPSLYERFHSGVFDPI